MMQIDELEARRQLVETPERLAVDPLGYVPRDASVHDQELIAFVAAGLAFGNVHAIGRSVGRVVQNLHQLEKLGFEGHRWVRGPDLVNVLGRIRQLQTQDGSLGATFEKGYVPGDMRASLSAFARRLREGLPQTRGVVTLTTSPDKGSACKRMNLFMRWMVRSGDIDLGLWRGVSAADLIMPLDVHVVRYARRFGLTGRTTQNWKMAEEITDHFRVLCPTDPVRFDFTISHYGMLHSWEDNSAS